MSEVKQKRRWSDRDQHFGPFTYSRDEKHHRPLSVVLDSGEKEHPGCHLRVRGFGHTVIVELPTILKPWRRWVDCSGYQWADGPNAGYWSEHSREYGFSLSEGFLQVFLGAQTHDSETTQSWSKFLPWTQWHFHRHSYHGLDGELLREWIEPRRRLRNDSGIDRYSEQRAFKETMPKVVFEIEDHDGQRIRATTYIEEREWTFGDGGFQWLRFFRRNMVRRSLDIDFDKEVGPEKGSWKGGMMGTSIEVLPGELHEGAFRRFCEQDLRSKYRNFRVSFAGRLGSQA